MERDEYFVRATAPMTYVNKAGASARVQAETLRRQSPIKAAIARVMGVHTDERAWRVGAQGEERVAQILRGLPEGWFVFNDLEVGDRGANIDHLVLGPGGVFTLNTKNLSGKVWLSERTLMVNGYRTDYLPKATAEARRAERLLRRASERRVGVRPVLVVLCHEMTTKARPSDVTVLRSVNLLSWFRKQPPVLSRDAVAAVARAANRPETWR